MNCYVIIGNGVAAVGCIEGIRKYDKDTEITVVSEEDREVYSRPLISYYLQGKTDVERMKYRCDGYYEKMGCKVLYGRKAVRIDDKEECVYLDDGDKLSYKSLCVATGSRAFVPPFKGLESVKNKFSFMTMDDALEIDAAIDENSRVLIIGAGLIGLKCAEGLSGRVKSITVCDLSDRVLSSILDGECSDIVKTHLEKNGIELMLSDSAESFEGNAAVMKSGKRVEFDVLVLAVGVRPNTDLVKNIGGDVNKGIVINAKMETSISGIYSVGDCTETIDISSGERKVMAILPNAYMQGQCAGCNMAGGNELFDDAIPMNSIGFFGLHIMSAGTYSFDDGVEVFEEKGDGFLKRLFVREGLLKGFILVGKTERAGIYTSLIREKTDLDTVNFDMLKKIATTAAFSEKNRMKKFGGVV